MRRAVEAAQAAAQIPDHPRLDQVFDVFAEGGSLWIVSELVAATPLTALLAEQPLTPYRAAEVASDVLMALRVLHAHGWVHRNITARTVLVCEDGRVILTGLAAGAAEEALCGYDPVPAREPEPEPGTTDRDSTAPVPAPRPGGSGGDPFGPGGRCAVWTPMPRGGQRSRRGRTVPLRARARPAPVCPPWRPARWNPRRTCARHGPGRSRPTAPEPGPRHGCRRNSAAPTRRCPHPARPRPAPTPRRSRRPARAAAPTPRPRAGSPTSMGRAVRRPGTAPSPAPRPPPTTPHPGLRATAAARTTRPRSPFRHPLAPPRPRHPLAAERARQARMAVVGPVTERWAPEQAGPVHENWQLAPPIGPATDLWALGALLFRAVQGHAPYPEESTAELVQLVCSEPPAFAEECGPLRPVVESLLRQDPTERPDFEELRGWLRSLVRSAPEPEAGTHVIAAPPVDPARLPIVRRRGELVRRRRAGLPATTHARHKRAKDGRPQPRRLGRTLLLLILLALAAAIAYAMAFMPKAGTSSGSGTAGERTGTAGKASPAPQQSDTDGAGQPQQGGSTSPSKPADSPQTQATSTQVAQGFTLRKDPEGFSVAVADGWDRTPKNAQGQVVYSQGDFQLIVVPGRDTTGRYGSDPLTYQRESEPELQPFRDSTWATSSGMRRIDVGGRTMVEGQFTWTNGNGQQLFVRNLAVLVGGHYHVVQVRGPDAERDEVTRLFEQAEATYRVTN
ncbi:protein kinase [Streptomyces cynarae]|uniref:protein kinase n=1 Tax=Streptomyces cynarae TaxID=2981134 RepID=UPI0028BE7FE3|nr:protein kinase [Streptomyces cynarae]